MRDPDRDHHERELQHEHRQTAQVAGRAPEVRDLADPDARHHPEIAEHELGRRSVCGTRAVPREGAGDGHGHHAVERERRDDVGREAVTATGRRHSHRRLSNVSRWLERAQRSCWRQNVRQSDGASVYTTAVDW